MFRKMVNVVKMKKKILYVFGGVEADAVEGALHGPDDVEYFPQSLVTFLKKQNGILKFFKEGFSINSLKIIYTLFTYTYSTK